MHELEQRWRLVLTADGADRSREDDERGLDRDPVPEAQVARVARRSPLQTVGDDRGDAWIRRCLRDDGFRAGREAEQADVPDACCLEVVDRAAHVPVPTPAECVLVPLALPAPARVVQQHAVAGGREQSRVADRPLAVATASVHEHDRGAVRAGHVPAGETHAVGRRERDVAMRQLQRLGVDRLPGLREVVDRQQQRVGEEEEDEHGTDGCTAAQRPGTAPRPLSVHAPGGRDTGHEQEHAAGDRQRVAGDQPAADEQHGREREDCGTRPARQQAAEAADREQWYADNDEHAQARAVQRDEAQQRAGRNDGGHDARGGQAKRAAKSADGHTDTVAEAVTVVGTANPRLTAAST